VIKLVTVPDGLAQREVAWQHHVGAVERDDQQAVHRPRADAGYRGEQAEYLLIGEPPQTVLAERAVSEPGCHGAQRLRLAPGKAGFEQVGGVKAEQFRGGRQPAAEQVGQAPEYARRRPDRQLLSRHHEDQRAECVHRRQVAQPAARVEIGVRVDDPCEHRIGPAQVGERKGVRARRIGVGGGIGVGGHAVSLPRRGMSDPRRRVEMMSRRGGWGGGNPAAESRR